MQNIEVDLGGVDQWRELVNRGRGKGKGVEEPGGGCEEQRGRERK